ncbi:hypothetical protein DL89DRAFT_183987 [Linderina pennispora]|uniref:Uncharacterized protein n=1 Tax=Linderina pennispora TaxID=61395 RepID=A0A1Y1W5I2_9FUNG|nr:uncharacterized protein DL89DRAFT_183987 [Linderina pennispora]ORX68790.1 hypothetical protein DL89DRAFT_183987 [Linderina pennispora]
MAVKTMDALVSRNSTGILPASHGYANTSQSPVPTLTNSTSRSSSASSSVNTLSPDSGLATTPRDLLPQFNSAGKRKHQEPIEQEASDAEPRPKHKRRRAQGKRKLTGRADFVRRLGLYSMYEEYVRPYTGDRVLPDMVTAYLAGVRVRLSSDDSLAERAGKVGIFCIVLAAMGRRPFMTQYYSPLSFFVSRMTTTTVVASRRQLDTEGCIFFFPRCIFGRCLFSPPLLIIDKNLFPLVFVPTHARTSQDGKERAPPLVGALVNQYAIAAAPFSLTPPPSV